MKKVLVKLPLLLVIIFQTKKNQLVSKNFQSKLAPNLDTLSVPAVAPEDSESETQLGMYLFII